MIRTTMNIIGLILFCLYSCNTKPNKDKTPIIKNKNSRIDSMSYIMSNKKNEKSIIDEKHESNKFNAPVKSQNKNIPPKPKMLEDERVSRVEIAKLKKERESNLRYHMNEITKHCLTEKNDSLIIGMSVKPNGKIETYKIVKSSKAAQKKVKCIDEFMKSEQINLGTIKTTQNARTGGKARTINYTIPL